MASEAEKAFDATIVEWLESTGKGTPSIITPEVQETVATIFDESVNYPNSPEKAALSILAGMLVRKSEEYDHEDYDDKLPDVFVVPLLMMRVVACAYRLGQLAASQ